VIRKKIPLRHEVQVAVFVGTTPFNGEYAAGPMGMISGVDVTTALGPLCLGSEDQHGTGYAFRSGISSGSHASPGSSCDPSVALMAKR
jgi:hypothetical protein